MREKLKVIIPSVVALKIIIPIAIVVLVLIVAGILTLINSKEYKEKLITSELRTMTEEFYGYYYDENNVDKKATEYLAKFKDTGLGITLGDLKIYLESRTNKKYDSKKLEKCDVANTIVTVFPKSPYGKKDYRIEFKLSCK